MGDIEVRQLRWGGGVKGAVDARFGDTRERMCRYLMGRPGARIREVAVALGLHESTIRYHALRLHDARRVRVESDGEAIHLYLNGVHASR